MSRIYIVQVIDNHNSEFNKVIPCSTMVKGVEEFRKAKNEIISKYEELCYDFEEKSDIKICEDNDTNFTFNALPEENGWMVSIDLSSKEILE